MQKTLFLFCRKPDDRFKGKNGYKRIALKQNRNKQLMGGKKMLVTGAGGMVGSYVSDVFKE